MKKTLLLYLLGAGILSQTAMAEYTYRYPLKGVISVNESELDSHIEDGVTDPSCYAPENVGTVGSESGCKNLLIVDNELIREVLSYGYDEYGERTIGYPVNGSRYYMTNIFTGQVTSINSLFRYKSSFNENINYWDTSNMTNIGNVFSYSMFNQPLDNWDLSNVKTANGIFAYNTAFNQDISGWDLSSVVYGPAMFLGAASFNQPIGEWNFSSATSLFNMFHKATSFNQDISCWNVLSEEVKPSGFSSKSGIEYLPDYHPVWGTSGCH